jgi:PAS domain S-box-containing protein
MSSKTMWNVATTHRDLSKQGQHLGGMFDLAAVGVARVATDGHFLAVTPTLCRMLGYSKGELLKKTCEEITHSDDRAGEAGLLEKMLAGHRTSYKTEKRYICRSGSPLWVTETCSAVADCDGVFLYRVCLIQVNARKVAEEHFRSAVEAAANSLVMVNQKGKIVLMNSHAEQLFGYSRQELLGKPIEVILVSPFEKTQQAFLTEVTSQPEDRPMGRKLDAYGRRKDGELFPVELGLNRIVTPKGAWTLNSIVDLNEHTWAREKLRQTTVTIPVASIASIAGDTVATNHRP